VRLIKIITSVAVLGLALSACSLGQSGGSLGALQQLAKSCPSNHQVAGYAAIEDSANARGNSALTNERLLEVQDLADLAAACGGYLQVVAFSSSETAYQTLYIGPLVPTGATLNSRLLQVPGMVAAAMNTVRSALPRATRQLPADGTDVLSELTLAGQMVQQLGSNYQLHALILTDGVSNTGIAITNSAAFTMAAAVSLGKSVPVPSLDRSFVTFAGIGRVATGTPAPTPYVEALTAFYRIACSRTGATCTVVTNPIGEDS
jgi:hypothetical protein